MASSTARISVRYFSQLMFAAMASALATNGANATVPNAYSANYQEGFDTAYPIGYEVGFDAGTVRGTSAGRAAGKTEGYDDGWDSTYDLAYEAAYAIGKPIGEFDGYVDAFPAAVREGFAWAKEIHEILITSPTANDSVLAISLIDRWGDPVDWGSSGVTLSAGGLGINYAGDLRLSGGITITNNLYLPEIDWAAHYFDEGYDNGFAQGKSAGDQIGYDEAYPIAYAAAYQPAYQRGARAGTTSGQSEGHDSGYSDGWSDGTALGEDYGFTAGADLYAAGAELDSANTEALFAVYGRSLASAALSASQSVPVPEPAGFVLALGASLIACARRRR